ncbi:MAG TPA: hypothetical protein VF086_04350 [Propionibacteriaceae bacterium]
MGVIGEILPLAVGIAISPVLITLLLFLAVQQWRGRPAEGEQAAMPKWMSAIDSRREWPAPWTV